MEHTTDGKSPPERSPELLWNVVQHEMTQAFNEKKASFQCWPVFPRGEDDRYCNWIVVIVTDVHQIPAGAMDKVRIKIDESAWWEATRILPNPSPTILVEGHGHCSFSTYQVKVPRHQGNHNQPLFMPLEMTSDVNDHPATPVFSQARRRCARLHLAVQSTSQLADEIIKYKRVPEAAWTFHDPRHYRDIYRWGTEKEAEFEREAIRNFNLRSVYQCWLILCDPSNDDLEQRQAHHSREIIRQQCLVVLASTDTQDPFPNVGESCDIAFAAKMPALGNVAKDNHRLKRKDVNYVKGVRLDNPHDQLSLDRSKWSNHATFKVWVNWRSARNSTKPSLTDFTSLLDPNMLTTRHKNDQKTRISLDDKNSFQAHVSMDISDTTMSVELNALKTAIGAPPESRINDAFSFVRTFKNTGPNRNFDLLRAIPHLQNPDGPNSQLPQNLKALFQGLDEDQKQAYKALSDLPCRVGIFPAAASSGKTQLMLTIAALALSKYAPRAEVCSSATGDSESTGCPVLFIVEGNSPANAAATRVVEHFEKLGRTALRICRAFNINYEGKSSTRRYLKVDDNDEAASGFDFDECFPAHQPDYVPQARRGVRSECRALNLKESAQQFLKENAAGFPLLSKLVKLDPNSPELYDSRDDERHLSEWKVLFRAVLARMDFLVTTPVGAAKIAPYFRPRLCIFDESARARELSSLVAIANFPSVEAWLFTGTCEMTDPYVGSYGNYRLYNPCADQLKYSMMERCLRAMPDMPKLSVNHQAYGGLHELSSDLFWGGSIQSAFLDNERFPPSTMHLLEYCRNLASNPSLSVPRLLVHVTGSEVSDPEQKSKFNEQHLNWVIQRVVRDLVQDQQFRSTDDKEAGSIIITTPYKAQFTNYRKDINKLMRELDREHRLAGGYGRGLHREVLVEARTADTVQGQNGDLVIYDLVNSEVTSHVADPNRMCVALTRAKQAEIIIMHRGMVGLDGPAESRRHPGSGGSYIDLLYEHCKSHGQVAVVDMDEKGHDEKGHDEENYTVQSGVDISGHDLSAVPRQLPALPASLDLATEKVQVDAALSVPASDSQPPEAKHDEDGESMLQDAENFGFEMVCKAMELGLTLSSDMRKGE